MKKLPKLKTKVLLSPMHKITNLAFRMMCKEYGASLSSTELLSANAISKKNKSVLSSAKTCKKEKPRVIQIFGQNTEKIVEAAKIIENELEFEIIDFNLGCPSKKILEQGSGGALLKRKNKIFEIVFELVKAVNMPVTVKIRSGFDHNSINAVEIAKLCEKAGACAIIVHARTVEQGYSGKADWDIIKKVKENVKIPVIGNGDIFSPEDAKNMLEQTNCDYVMIGRGVIGNPFFFKQIIKYLKTGEIIEQTKEEKIKDYFRYIEYCKEYNIYSLIDAKIKAQEFTKGIFNSSKLRKKLNSIKSFEEIKELMNELLKKS